MLLSEKENSHLRLLCGGLCVFSAISGRSCRGAGFSQQKSWCDKDNNFYIRGTLLNFGQTCWQCENSLKVFPHIRLSVWHASLFNLFLWLYLLYKRWLSVFLFLSTFGNPPKKRQENQQGGILVTSKGTLCHILLNFRVNAWVKLWVRLRITQVVVMVMVWEHLQELNPSVCNVLTSDENKWKCPLVQHVCRWSFYIHYYITSVGRIDFGTNIYLLQSSSTCQVCLVCLLALPLP